jgi:ketosteroid isomerase-like protein
MTHPNAQAIQDFYAAFARRDAEGMIARYAPDVRFSDAVFTKLQGEEVFSMWRMLAERAKDLRVEASDIDADDATGRAHWEAWYTFSATGQPVHNRIDARFVFKDGKIVEHTDTFDLRVWAGMALGWKGKLLGWLPPVQASIRKNADAGLRAYMKKRGGG